MVFGLGEIQVYITFGKTPRMCVLIQPCILEIQANKVKRRVTKPDGKCRGGGEEDEKKKKALHKIEPGSH